MQIILTNEEYRELQNAKANARKEAIDAFYTFLKRKSHASNLDCYAGISADQFRHWIEEFRNNPNIT